MLCSRTFGPDFLPKPDLDKIEAGADRILAEVGVNFEGDRETLERWRQFGAELDGERVRLDGAALRATIRASAPSTIRLRARNGARDRVIGTGCPAVFAPAYGPPNVRRMDGTRLPGSAALYRELVALTHSCRSITNTGHMICVMNDLPEAERSMEMALAHLEMSDKPFMGTIASPVEAGRVIAAAELVIGRPPEVGACDLLHLINSTPPLTYKENPLKCLREVAMRRQGVVITSYMMLGATAPVTTGGALIQGYAEVLAGLALARLWSPGAPVVMGLFGAPFSMSRMQPFFGDPLTQLIQLYAVGLARRLGVPVRGDGGVTSANCDDAQAGYEGARATWFADASGSDFILHAGGWLESGRCVSMGKLAREAAAINDHVYGRGVESDASAAELDKAVVDRIRGNWTTFGA